MISLPCDVNMLMKPELAHIKHLLLLKDYSWSVLTQKTDINTYGEHLTKFIVNFNAIFIVGRWLKLYVQHRCWSHKFSLVRLFVALHKRTVKQVPELHRDILEHDNLVKYPLKKNKAIPA